MILKRLLLVAIATLLSACATGPRVIDTLVTTQAAHAPGSNLLPHARYRFADSSPTAGQPPITQLQAMAAAALARVGVIRDDANPTLTAQVDGRILAHWVYDPYWGPSNAQLALGMGYGGWGRGGWGMGMNFPLLPDATQAFLSEVSLVLRDAQTGQIVYDTRARHDGLRADNAVLTALFAAALQGYPNPPVGTRRVDIPLIPIAEPQPAPVASPQTPGPAPAAPGDAPAVSTPVPAQPALTPDAR